MIAINLFLLKANQKVSEHIIPNMIPKNVLINQPTSAMQQVILRPFKHEKITSWLKEGLNAE